MHLFRPPFPAPPLPLSLPPPPRRARHAARPRLLPSSGTASRAAALAALALLLLLPLGYFARAIDLARRPALITPTISADGAAAHDTHAGSAAGTGGTLALGRAAAAAAEGVAAPALPAAAPAPEPTPAPTSTMTPTLTPTPTSTSTPTVTPTPTPTSTSTGTLTATPTPPAEPEPLTKAAPTTTPLPAASLAALVPQTPAPAPPPPPPLLAELLSAVDGTDPELAVTSAGMARGGSWREVALQDPGGAGGAAPPPPPPPPESAPPVPPAPPAASISARDTAAVERRLQWVLQCHRTARTRTGRRAAGVGPEPQYHGSLPPHIAARAAGPHAFERSYYALKALTLLLHAALRPVWDECPQADAGFYAGPWLEDYWRANFARPVRREVLDAELDLERELIGEQAAAALLVRGDGAAAAGEGEAAAAAAATGEEGEIAARQSEAIKLATVAALAGISVISQTAASGIFEQEDLLMGGGSSARLRALLRDSVRAGGPRPEAALTAARNSGAPWSVVEYALDFDLFFPLVPVFAPWERLAMLLWKTTPPPGPIVFSEGHQQAVRLRRTLVRALHGFATRPFAAFVTVAQRAQGVLLPSGTRSDALFQSLVETASPRTRTRLGVAEDIARVHVLLRFLAKTLVINAGGGGDVAIPLLARELAPEPPGPEAAAGASRPLLLSFTGRLYDDSSGKGDSQDLRSRAMELAKRHPVVGPFLEHYYDGPGVLMQTSGKAPDAPRPGRRAPTYEQPTFRIMTEWPRPGADGRYEWMAAMRRSAFQLAPSGTNPTSFRLYEALQLGHVPVFVFADHEEQPWLPFHDFGPAVADPRRWSAANDESGLRLWHRVGIVVPLSRFGELLDALGPLAANTTYMDGKRALVRAARDRFFTYAAVVRHLWRLFDDPPTADLKCQQPPKTFF